LQEVVVLISRMWSRIVLCGVLVGIGFASLATLAPMSVGAKANGALVQLHKTKRGMLLVNRAGFTLYMFSSDKLRKDTCMTKRGCTSVWPIERSAGKPIAGKGVKPSLLGTITLPGGRRQVTYGGHPLYSYTGDVFAGEADYIGTKQFGGVWHGVSAASRGVK